MCLWLLFLDAKVTYPLFYCFFLPICISIVRSNAERLSTSCEKYSYLQEEEYLQRPPPKFPEVKTLEDLSDGICLGALCSLYCPNDFEWWSIANSQPMSMADSLYNLQALKRFCSSVLPYDPFCLQLEDFLYMHRYEILHNIVDAVVSEILSLRLSFECPLQFCGAKCHSLPGRVVLSIGSQSLFSCLHARHQEWANLH